MASSQPPTTSASTNLASGGTSISTRNNSQQRSERGPPAFDHEATRDWTDRERAAYAQQMKQQRGYERRKDYSSEDDSDEDDRRRRHSRRQGRPNDRALVPDPRGPPPPPPAMDPRADRHSRHKAKREKRHKKEKKLKEELRAQHAIVKKQLERALNTDAMVMNLQRFNPGGLDMLAGYPRRFRVTLHVDDDDVHVREIQCVDYLSDEDEYYDDLQRTGADYRDLYGMRFPPGLGPYGPRLAQNSAQALAAQADRVNRYRQARQMKQAWMDAELSSDDQSDSDEDDQYFRSSRRRMAMGNYGRGGFRGAPFDPMMNAYAGGADAMVGGMGGMYPPYVDDCAAATAAGMGMGFGVPPPYRRFGGRRCRSSSPGMSRAFAAMNMGAAGGMGQMMGGGGMPMGMGVGGGMPRDPTQAVPSRTTQLIQPYQDGAAPRTSGVSRLVAPLQPITPLAPSAKK
eukprot:gnl/Spiro4/10510_TR5628_c0_g1_i1.p1 gnl/Spiro4/10510_TR5628_c0_g1~~gnl/Spiro4/10510_TR5628_c0_g1_i1.p1  ORF type:complete len:456 (-),score=73.99 gnl/Spiro4/10510_TR5628_c0_g1_i1:191-1558(-)